MAILIDPPVWPAHGQVWSHLISDSSYAELHEFAAMLGVPRRAFDFDHYDVPESLYGRALELGATPVAGRQVVFALQRADLRVRQADRERLRPVRRRAFITGEWGRIATLVDGTDDTGQEGAPISLGTAQFAERFAALGSRLLGRWNETHRHYHDERHLEDVLLALSELKTRGERVSLPTLIAAWFHDAIYTGGGSDEVDSADLAARELQGLGFAGSFIEEVHALVLATAPGSEQHLDTHLLDADLWVFASSHMRYAEYIARVRAEYAHIAPEAFQSGRAQILEHYLARPNLYFTDPARERWETRARANVTTELATLRGLLT